MTQSLNNHTIVVRTERGLSITGTRITLYQILDYLYAKWPPKLIQDWLNLTQEQMDAALAYIDTHRADVEREYQQVIHEAEERQHYWEAQRQEHLVAHQPMVLTSEQQALRAKLDAWKARLKAA